MDLVKAFAIDDSLGTVSITPTVASSNVQLNEALGPGGLARGMIRIFNNTGSPVFLRFGSTNAVVATVTDTPLPTGSVEVFTLRPADLWVAAILASGTATGAIYFTHGEGI